MGKKIRQQYLTGALLQPFFQFINKAQFGINPISDPRGTKIAQYYHKWITNTKPIFKGEKFQNHLNYDLTSNSSYMIFHYLNGMKQGFLLKDINIRQMELEHDLIKRIVEMQRACEGHQDEYEDEVRK